MLARQSRYFLQSARGSRGSSLHSLCLSRRSMHPRTIPFPPYGRRRQTTPVPVSLVAQSFVSRHRMPFLEVQRSRVSITQLAQLLRNTLCAYQSLVSNEHLPRLFASLAKLCHDLLRDKVSSAIITQVPIRLCNLPSVRHNTLHMYEYYKC